MRARWSIRPPRRYREALYRADLAEPSPDQPKAGRRARVKPRRQPAEGRWREAPDPRLDARETVCSPLTFCAAAPTRGAAAERDYGFVVDSVNVSVFAYAPGAQRVVGADVLLERDPSPGRWRPGRRRSAASAASGSSGANALPVPARARSPWPAAALGSENVPLTRWPGAVRRRVGHRERRVAGRGDHVGRRRRRVVLLDARRERAERRRRAERQRQRRRHRAAGPAAVASRRLGRAAASRRCGRTSPRTAHLSSPESLTSRIGIVRQAVADLVPVAVAVLVVEHADVGRREEHVVRAS